MSDLKLHPKDDKEKTEKRNLPSWMNSNDDENKPHKEKQVDSASQDKVQGHKGPKELSKQSTNSHSEQSSESTLHFSKLLEGVVFVLSGFVNPERSTLRSQALEMGGEYRPDWTSECTLLVCAFPNTPKFRQVEADCGTIVSRDWIAECYNQKKLVEIDRFLMHAGKPWRKSDGVPVCKRDQGSKISAKVSKQLERRPLQTVDDSSISGSGVCESSSKHLSPSLVKEWAIVDLTATMSWLEKQEERPEPDEIKKIAAEGIIICLQDTIEALDNNQLDGRTRKDSLTKEELSKLALDCKHVYEEEFNRQDDSSVKRKRCKAAGDNYNDQKQKVAVENEGFDNCIAHPGGVRKWRRRELTC
ncbi:hypothetical protein Taro_022342 [Colocasia esculenta]|uniref:BRCT domain-containing protein n=1 Tax=Colocasia esculenta TaxID=4460 RepID=A0A843V7L3_COLES|nr:hypothetical protein [Colocasia esculenta]